MSSSESVSAAASVPANVWHGVSAFLQVLLQERRGKQGRGSKVRWKERIRKEARWGDERARKEKR